MPIFAKKGGGLSQTNPPTSGSDALWSIIFFLTAQLLFVLMTYKHNLVTNSIELWIDEITSPSAYSRIKEALKLACFREILLCSVHLCGQLQIGLWKYWTFLLFGHVASFLKEIGVDDQKK